MEWIKRLFGQKKSTDVDSSGLSCSQCGKSMPESKLNRKWGICKSCRRVHSMTGGGSRRQADHYIIRVLFTNKFNQDYLIDKSLEANGYKRGNATIDFRFTEGIDEVYMYGLSRAYAINKGVEIDDDKSKMHNISGGATGKLVAVFTKRN